MRTARLLASAAMENSPPPPVTLSESMVMVRVSAPTRDGSLTVSSALVMRKLWVRAASVTVKVCGVFTEYSAVSKPVVAVTVSVTSTSAVLSTNEPLKVSGRSTLSPSSTLRTVAWSSKPTVVASFCGITRVTAAVALPLMRVPSGSGSVMVTVTM